MQTSYQLRNITARTTLPDGTNLNASQYGPAVGGQYPLGSFLEDYEYVAGSGDLDEHNGRFCITPDYPSGIYAYFVTIDSNEDPVYPYVIGPAYYGTVQAGNTGPGSGHNTISEPVTTYTTGTSAIAEHFPQGQLSLLSNDGSGTSSFILYNTEGRKCNGALYDMSGKQVKTFPNLVPDVEYAITNQGISHGIYMLEVTSGTQLFKAMIIQ